MINQHIFLFKIECTNENYLSFNNKKIDKEHYIELISRLNPEDDLFINQIQILTKTILHFELKYLEFLCNKELTNTEIKKYITKMKDCGIESNIDNNSIICTNLINNEMIYKISFNNEEFKPINCILSRRKNKSSNNIDILYPEL